MNPLLERTLGLYHLLLFELINGARQVHRRWRHPTRVH